MIKLTGTRIPVALVDKHSHICDLLYLDGPIVSLYRDSKQSWIYLWCDTTSSMTTHRWLLFSVTRSSLVSYLQKEKALRVLVEAAPTHLILDISSDPSIGDESGRATLRTLREISVDSLPNLYFPAEDSYFDETLSPDISLAMELSPTSYEVPIAGDWFFSDLDRFSRLYTQLYAFFYCTQPRFVTNLGQRLQRFLEAPWQGGFSRVNLFSALERLVPSLHDLEIKKFQYASPGSIHVEALASVGQDISAVVSRFLENEKLIVDAEKAINAFLARNRLNKQNVSKLTDSQIGLSEEQMDFLVEKGKILTKFLQIEAEIAEISLHSPNIIITAKALSALVRRIRNICEFQKNGLIDI